MKHTCGQCNSTWKGASRAHCAGACHQTFDSVALFDNHRDSGKCREPQTQGLVNYRDVWMAPGQVTRLRDREDHMTAMRAARRTRSA